MNNTVLRLLQIFEEETDNEHMLSKNDILDILVSEGFDTINEKQFYRKIEELIDNGYPIEKRKGRTTKYFMRKNRLTKEEWIYIMTLILGNQDLSIKETRHMIEALESMNVSYKCIDSFEEYKPKAVAVKSKYNQLNNFRTILKAIELKQDIECKEYNCIDNKDVFSDLKVLSPYDFYAKDNRITILVKENNQNKEYLLSHLIDVDIV